MHRAGKLAVGFFFVALAGDAAAQEAQYRRDGARLWRVEGSQRWLVDGRIASLRLEHGGFEGWRAALPAGSTLRGLISLRVNRLGWIDVELPAGSDALEVLA